LAELRHRPPFAKDLKTCEPFTFNELEKCFPADHEEFYAARWTACARVVENEFQFYMDDLPFGVRVHRNAGIIKYIVL
jgi:hypothetical protein